MSIALSLLVVATFQREFAPTIHCGWHDELDRIRAWKPLEMENQPEVFASRRGLLNMRLPHVPNGWPYEYQWSGVTREAVVDLDKYPVIVARVSEVEGYAHMDIEESDIAGKPVWTMRSTTLTTPGLSIADVGKDHHGTLRLKIRLIVGGPNSGCRNGYSWVRFVRQEDLTFLSENPDWQKVVWDR